MRSPADPAAYVAFYRALETSRRGPDRLFVDPFAEWLLPPALALRLRAARAAHLTGVLARLSDRLGYGVRTAAALRTRFIDDFVRARASRVDQIVILGAGLDCRAHRLPELRGVRVFEVDRPEVFERKRRGLSRVPEGARQDVHYVGLDLRDDSLGARLEQAGFRPESPALFLCEGILNYLPEEAAVRLLGWIGRSAAGSSVVFTYVDRGLFDGSLGHPDREAIVERVRALAEPWNFGFEPRTLDARLRDLGLALGEDVTVGELRRRYAHPARDAALFTYSRIATAEV